MSLVKSYAIECDRCHVTVGWSVTSQAARAERRKAGWRRDKDSPFAKRGQSNADLCCSCASEVDPA